jgi:hypothetical protein
VSGAEHFFLRFEKRAFTEDGASENTFGAKGLAAELSWVVAIDHEICGYICRVTAEKAQVLLRKIRDAGVDSTQRGAFWAYVPLEATMKHLKVAASVVNQTIFVSCSISCSSVPPPPAGPVGHAMLAPHLPRAVANGQAAMMGAVSPQQRLKLAIRLPLRNQAELTQLLHDLYDPKSPNFHKYLSVSEFTKRYAVAARDYNTVVAWTKANGLTVTAKTPNRRLLAVEGSVATVNRAFHVKVNYYQRPGEARTFYSPDREPTVVALSVPLLQITGMNNHVLPQSMLRHNAVASATEPVSATGSGPAGEYLPSDMRAAYYGKGPLTGAGQTIGILSFDGYLASDVQLYYSKTGMTSNVQIKNVLVDGFSGACTTVSSPPKALPVMTASRCSISLMRLAWLRGSSRFFSMKARATPRFSIKWRLTMLPRCSVPPGAGIRRTQRVTTRYSRSLQRRAGLSSVPAATTASSTARPILSPK